MATSDQVGSQLIKAAQKAAQKTLKGAKSKQLQIFMADYFGNVPAQDVAGLDGAALMRLANGHLSLGETRKAKSTKIRAYNPDQKRDGWTSKHSVIEIVTDDMPFLVDSVSAELTRQELPINMVIHPIYKVRRNKNGKIADILERGQKDVDARAESYMHFQITQQPRQVLDEIVASLTEVLSDVRATVEDWRPMRERMEEAIDELSTEPRGVNPEESEEVRELLRWLHDNHYTFLGFREYRVSGAGKKSKVTVEESSGLGVLRNPEVSVFVPAQSKDVLSPEIARSLTGGNLLTVSKTNQRSKVHRSVHMDAIGINKIDDKGKVVAHFLFVGLFTSVAYNLSPRNIPLLRRRIQNVVEKSGYTRDSHDGKALLNILETYPRDELFQIDDDTLADFATGILHLQERQRTALFVRHDTFGRYLSCLAFVPRDRYNTELRKRIQEILAEAFGGQPSAFFTHLGDSPLARVHLIITMQGKKVKSYDIEAIEKK